MILPVCRSIRFQQAIQPNDAQRTALDDLGNASVKAAQGIKTACPTQISLTAPNRLAAMQTRIEAMIAAVGTVQPAMDNFYGLLNDEQKARLNALGQDQYKKRPRRAPADRSRRVAARRSLELRIGRVPRSMRQCIRPTPSAPVWPRFRTPAQRRRTMLKASCQIDAAVTPPARLAAVGKRLDVMLQAVTTVRTALDDFYGKLSDEQKAQFEAIGPGRTASSGASSAQPVTAQAHRRHHASIGGIVRRLISFAR